MKGKLIIVSDGKHSATISVEYISVPDKGTKAEALGTHVRKIMPVVSKDWPNALSKLGTEVEFRIVSGDGTRYFSNEEAPNGEMAKLIPPVEIYYTEAEAIKFASDVFQDIYFNISKKFKNSDETLEFLLNKYKKK